MQLRGRVRPPRIRQVAVLVWLVCLVAGCEATRPLPDPLQAGWRGRPVCEKLHEDDQLRVLRCTFAPGVGHERHFHAAHFGYVLAGGRMRIVDARGTREVELVSASTFSSEGIDWHEVLNIGQTTAVFLIVEPK